MQTSKYGRSAFTKSPIISSNFRCSGLPHHQPVSLATHHHHAGTHLPKTRFVTSLAIRGSISTATTFRHCSRIRTVKFPVPGPTSRTTSVCFRFACGEPNQHADQPTIDLRGSPYPRSYPKAISPHAPPHTIHETHPCATNGFIKICCPNLAVSNKWFFPPPPLAAPSSPAPGPFLTGLDEADESAGAC